MSRELSESEIRDLRNRVFCQVITDNEWSNCKKHWMSKSGIAFLQSHDFPISESLQHYGAWAARPPTLVKKSC